MGQVERQSPVRVALHKVKQHGHLMRGSGERRDCLRDQMLLRLRSSEVIRGHQRSSRLPDLIEPFARARPLGHIEESVVSEVLGRPRRPDTLDGLAVVIDEVVLGEHVPGGVDPQIGGVAFEEDLEDTCMHGRVQLGGGEAKGGGGGGRKWIGGVGARRGGTGGGGSW